MWFWIAILIIASVIGIINEKSRVCTIILLLFTFVMIAFCKNTTENADYLNYVIQYDKFRNGIPAGAFEPLYRGIMTIFSKIIPKYDVFKIILSVMQLYLIYISITKLTNGKAMVLGLYLIYPVIINGELTRYVMAEMIVILAISLYISDIIAQKDIKKTTIRHIILVVIAGMIHSSLLVYAIFACIGFFIKYENCEIKVQIKKIVFPIIAIFVLCVVGYILISLGFIRLPIISDRLSLYNKDKMSDGLQKINIIMYNGAIHFIRIAFSGYLYFFVKKNELREENIDSDYKVENYNFNSKLIYFILLINLLSIVFLIPHMLTVTFNRVYRIIDLFNYIGASAVAVQCSHNSRQKRIIKSAAFGYATILLIIFLLQGSYYRMLYSQLFEYNSILNFFR